MPPSASENGDRGFIAVTKALPSWNDRPAKQAIIDFVARCTDETGPEFVRPTNRIATFDQDGTLWVEQPIYAQVIFAFERLAARAAEFFTVASSPFVHKKSPFRYALRPCGRKPLRLRKTSSR
jgi:hypothetical protein